MLTIYRDEDLPNPSPSPTFLKLLNSSPRVLGEDQSHKLSTPPKNKKKRNEIEDHHQIWSRESSYCTTPTAKQHKIPEAMTCPPAPKKQRHYYVLSSSAKAKKRSDYFIPPPNFEAIFLTTKNKSSCRS
ncbi:hypothetical protein MKW98_003465 [Papaver atlanticum]|uniref:Uncharacterized protein n=1 Tax=Papaver atlanticum TaxID=357466 RepID=A0AAD4XUU2_9MAGN|nr:hypothetical protein MKW92_051718 [Papaver armeniacum]KAI3946902.1 hypothetical protein MKW98_003465 [Papaver atlanticum]